MEKCSSKKVFNMMFFLVILLLFTLVFSIYKNSILKNEVAALKNEKIKLLEEHGECLKNKENTLKKELIGKYVESMIALRNKIEKGYVPDNKDMDNFFDRSNYIINNLEVYEPAKEEISQHLIFLSSMKSVLEPFSKKTVDEEKQQRK
ncbi:MAG TPA: hypothetical protein PKG52_02660 [bacterium]|nr:hypothetical protein [bacterium]HPS29501.1 hypothetical protein [bacterium]